MQKVDFEKCYRDHTIIVSKQFSDLCYITVSIVIICVKTLALSSCLQYQSLLSSWFLTVQWHLLLSRFQLTIRFFSTNPYFESLHILSTEKTRTYVENRMPFDIFPLIYTVGRLCSILGTLRSPCTGNGLWININGRFAMATVLALPYSWTPTRYIVAPT